MPKHWIFDRQDPRTVLLTAIVILAVGGLVTPGMLGRGGVERLFAIGWIVVSIAQTIWAAARYRRWRRAGTD